MDDDKFQLHPGLQDASLEAVCKMANRLVKESQGSRGTVSTLAFDVSYMLEYLRLNFDLVPKK